MKTLKLWVHKRKITDKQVEEILINPKELAEITVGDVVEIYHPEEEYSRLLLQINTLPDDFQPKDNIVSIEHSIATAFQLKSYQNVIVNKVDKKQVSLDLVEILFKDQYYSRSDMHRLRTSMIGSCVYLNKKIEFSEMRAQVNELWCRGEKVTCGVVSEDTRIVYRSSTAVVQIFIQMSSEMWDFDINGDLYFEKAVNGFLTDLYAKWKEQNCLHDVTIVMFSRTFYEAHSRDEFPQYMQECLQQDYMGRFYEDFYRIVVQNERYEEWTGTIKQLRKIFNEYSKMVLNYHTLRGYKVPKAYNSAAAQGNFLETLNMSLNLFERYYMDRNFDRTGKVAVVITPGAGVFEVDRELTNITKQRTIDCGVGSDLVCMGEQPLHAAPLFKFHSKNRKIALEVGDDYNIPHWMNHSCNFSLAAVYSIVRHGKDYSDVLNLLVDIGHLKCLQNYAPFHLCECGLYLTVGLSSEYSRNIQSFYTSKNQIQFYSNKTFVPRIKIPPEIFDKKKQKETVVEQDLSCGSDDDNFPFVDYDEYDAQVFKLPNRNVSITGYRKASSSQRRKSDKYDISKKQPPQTFLEAKLFHIPRTRHISDDVSLLPVEKPDLKLGTSPAVSIPSNSSSGENLSSSLGCYPILEKKSTVPADSESDTHLDLRPIVGSAGSPVGHRNFLHHYKRHRALINPFAPSRMQFKMTSNRRRWIHAFPTDPHGVAVQTHHVHTYSYNDNNDQEDVDVCELTPEVIEAAELAVKARKEQGTSRSSDMLSDTSTLDDLVSLSGASPLRKGMSHEYSRSSMYSQRDYRGQRSFMWGPTGEQEWSPELTTGVDWKSLTMPASLPITTDYFPDTISLQNDYVVSDYSLLPDEVNSDYYMKEVYSKNKRPPVTEDEKYYRKQPLSTKEVFKELISQRLAQGFQLITMLKVSSAPQILGTGQANQRYILGSSPQISHMSVHMSGLIRARPREEQSVEVYLSIGRIFHKLTLSGPTITVTRYRPRHPNSQMCYSYKYRFQAPDSFHYDISWSEFRNEKLENYNWNYLDQYICTRGEGDFGLMDSLKFWRSRFYILPCSNQATKKIIEGSHRCDIYEDKTAVELKQLVTGFTRYLETLNKMKRTAVTRQTSCQHTEFLDKNPKGIPQPDTRPESEILTTSSPSEKIVKWMLDPACGIPMLPKQHGLPTQCFISAEIVDWCYYHVKGVKGVKSAMDMLQRVYDDGYIIHASGSPSHKMIYGFYLYTFVSKDKPKEEQGLFYNPLFQNDWCEVAFVPIQEDVDTTLVKFSLDEKEGSPPTFDLMSPLQEDWRIQTGLNKTGHTWAQQSEELAMSNKARATLMHKYVNVDVDPQTKSDRPEWATARYHAHYSPHCGFELQVQWMVATGQILGDLINNWARKAGVCGFHLMPVPVDPFALPTAPDSDPLRGPIFVPLNVGSMEPGGALFQGHDEDTRQQKLLLLQETIIRRFGFMGSSVRLANKSSTSHSMMEEHHQYVHCTGGMNVIIEGTHTSSPSPITKEMKSNKRFGNDRKEHNSTGSLTRKTTVEMRKDYIARQTSQTFNQQNIESDHEVGFLWSWNFMSSRRWRSSNTGDEHFQDRVLSDFRAFCSNEEDRLQTFWNEYKENNFV